MKYTITEKQNMHSIREGYTIDSKSLRSAKMLTRKNQFYQGTVLVIEDGAGIVVATHKDGKWVDKGGMT